jgi:hypothetical protein
LILGGLLCALPCALGCDSSSVDVGSNVSDGGRTSVQGHAGARSGSKPDAGSARGCPTGFTDCDGDTANGCEVELARDRDHCGKCGNACASADCLCQDGALVAHCTGERADCNGDPRDGCEIDMASDSNHCGSCERACPSRGFDAFGASCVRGQCMLVCEMGMADCDADPSTGCEVFLFFDNSNCGACGVACNCNAGRCTN